MQTAELIKKVRRIEIKTRGLTSQVFSGEYHSAFKGRGMAFSEVREYQPGDDIRSIDWNVTARFGTPYVKIFEEERELTVMLLVDVSRSERFGTRTQQKKDLVTELSALLAFAAIQNNDKIGVIFFSDRVEQFIPPKKGRTHILRIIREMLEIEPQGRGTDIGAALQYFSNVIKKRSIVFLLSDFMDRQYESAMRIASRKHDLVALRVFDQGETELPPIGLVRFHDPELDRELWVDTSNKKAPAHYRAWWLEREHRIKQTFRSAGVDSVTIRTDQSYVKPLMNFFRSRERAR